MVVKSRLEHVAKFDHSYPVIPKTLSYEHASDSNMCNKVSRINTSIIYICTLLETVSVRYSPFDSHKDDIND